MLIDLINVFWYNCLSPDLLDWSSPSLPISPWGLIPVKNFVFHKTFDSLEYQI